MPFYSIFFCLSVQNPLYRNKNLKIFNIFLLCGNIINGSDWLSKTVFTCKEILSLLWKLYFLVSCIDFINVYLKCTFFNMYWIMFNCTGKLGKNLLKLWRIHVYHNDYLASMNGILNSEIKYTSNHSMQNETIFQS